MPQRPGTPRARALTFALFVFLLLLVTAFSIYVIYRISAFKPWEETKPEGFGAQTTMKPLRPSDRSPCVFDPKPGITSTQKPSYSLIMQWTFQNISMHVSVGNTVSISLMNTGKGEVYAYRIGIEWKWQAYTKTYEETSGFLVNPATTRDLGLVSFPAPGATGNCSYRIVISLLAQNPLGDWTDLGKIENDRRHVDVLPLERRTGYENVTNPNGYFQLVNGLFKDATWLAHKAIGIVGNSTDAPNTYHLCKIFDFIKGNMSYISDPKPDENEWMTPRQAIERSGGDCEDQALALAGLMKALGATVRCHFTSNHAFASVFCGGKEDLKNATASIGAYYGMQNQRPDILCYSDTFGYWIMADPLAGFYPGAPPLGYAPVDEKDGGTIWDFCSTQHLINIDITAV